MANVIMVMFIADIVFVFFGSCGLIIYALWKLVSKQYNRMTGNEPEKTMPAKEKLRVREKATQGAYDVYETRTQNGVTQYKIYKGDRTIWVDEKDYIPYTVNR